MISGTLITRIYDNFKGVDFSNNNISLYRSPDSLNMFKNYQNSLGKYIETRPDIELHSPYSNTIFGHFFYSVGSIKHEIVHSGTKLYDNGLEIFTGMNVRRSLFFVFNNVLYIKDGINYLEYDGVAIKTVEGYIPTTTISKSPAGDGKPYQRVNLLTGVRINSFVSDGKSTDYYLDTEGIDSNYTITIIANGNILIQTIDFNVDYNKGKITFNEVVDEPLSEGKDNVFVTFRKTISGYRDRIDKCTLLTVFDNRVFFSGNPDYPNALFHCELENPRYVSDLSYYNEGLDLSPIKVMVTGNNALWALKEPSQANTTVFYHVPVIDSEYGKIYPSNHSSISTGCIASGINFNDDIIFFSTRGMEAISGDINSEQLLAHRSSLVDNKMLNESNYKNLMLEEWQGYLLVIFGNKIYLADSRQKFMNNDHYEYEWYYWELSKVITSTCVEDNILYLGSTDGIYKLTKNNCVIDSYWTTPNDEFKYPHYQKTTNKRGGTADVIGEEIKIEVSTDGNNFEVIDLYENSKNYIVYKIKRKKWKSIQMKFSSTKPFGLISATLEAFIGAYLKR